MKQILVMGAGKSSTALITYLLQKASLFQWHITVADADLANAQEKLSGSEHATAYSLNVEDRTQRIHFIAKSDIVISL